MGKTNFDSITIPATGTVALGTSKGFQKAKIVAHPSNAGPVYVKNATDTVIGYPLGAGSDLDLGSGNLVDFVASGTPNARLSIAYEQ